MAELNYTKGNWYIDCNNADDATRDYDVFAWIEGSKQYPCHIAEINHCTEEVEANAHLISAAPDMYEALKKTQLLVSSIDTDNLVDKSAKDTALSVIKKALAKAKGG